MNTKNEKVYCICCKKKVSISDVQHGGAEIIVEAMKYPVCSKCIKRRDGEVIRKIKARREGKYE